MATQLTYDTLVARVRRFVERDTVGQDPSFETELPYLINDAEREIATELKTLGFSRTVTGTMVAGQSVYPKPARWKQTISINFGVGTLNNQRTPLFQRDYEYIRSYWPDQTVRGVPEFYADDYHFTVYLFGGTPDAAYPYEINYYQLLQLLDSSNQTNWLTEEEPELLLYGTLLKAAPYLKNDPRIPTWQEKYDRRLLAAKGQDVDRTKDRSAERGNQP